MKLFYGNVS